MKTRLMKVTLMNKWSCYVIETGGSVYKKVSLQNKALENGLISREWQHTGDNVLFGEPASESGQVVLRREYEERDENCRLNQKNQQFL